MLEEAIGAKLIYNAVPQPFWNGSVLTTHLRRNQPLPGNSNRNIRKACYRCGRDSHSVSNCFSRTNANGEGLESFDSDWIRVFFIGARCLLPLWTWHSAHSHADTINLLLSIGESTLSVINSETPVSPVPYGDSPHIDVNARIKVLTRRITIYKSELPDKNRTSGPLPKYLQIRQFIGQDLVSLEGCFPNQKEFNDYTPTIFKWNLRFVIYTLLLHSGKEVYLHTGKAKMNLLNQANPPLAFIL